MNNRWNRFLSLLLALCTVLTMIPAGFALETTEELNQEPETGVDEVVPAEDPAAEAALTGEPAPDADAGIMPAATFIPDGSSEEEYPVINVSGTSYGSAAETLLDLLNQERASNAASILIRSGTATETAIAMAAEYVYGSDSARANGETWMSLLGDNELELNEGTSPLFAFVLTAEADAEIAMDLFMSYYPEVVDSTAYNNAGIGCFQLDNGSVYWALLLYSGTEYKNAAAVGDTAYSYDVPFDCDAICAYMDFDLEDYALNMGETFTLNVIMDNGYDQIVIPADALTFTTSDSKVVSITNAGKLSAVGIGNAVVTTTLKADEELSISANLTSTLNMIAPEVTTVNATNGVKVSWTASPGATHYLVFRSTKAGNWSGSVYNQVPASSTSYTDTTAVSGTTYYYTVRPGRLVNDKWTYGAYNVAGVSNTYVATPSLTSAKSSTDGITVSWKAVPGATYYHVYRKEGTSTSWTRLASFKSSFTSYIDVNVTSGTKYTYTVRASKGTTLSNFSASGISTTATTTVKTDPYIVFSKAVYRTGAGTSNKAVGTFEPGTRVNVIAGWSKKANGLTWYKFNANGQFFYIASSNLLGKLNITGVANTESGVKVSWNKVTNAVAYAVYRKAQGDKNWTYLGVIKSPNATSYTDANENLTSGTKYTYTVRAIAGSVLSDFNTAGVSLTFVKTPSLVSAVASSNSIVFTWEKIPEADGYYLFRKENNGSWTQLTTIKDPTVTSYTDTNVTSLVQYTYTVRAYVGSTLSYFVGAGASNVPFASGAMTTCTLLSATKYRTGAGTNYTALGTLRSGLVVYVVAADLNNPNLSWCRILINTSTGKTLRYVPKSALFATPKLDSIAIRSNGLQISWSKVSGATGYGIWRKTATTNWIRIATVGSSTSSYIDNSTATGTTYYYTVRAYKDSTLSWYDTTGIQSIFLSLPNLTNAVADNKGITVTWSRVEGAAGYYVCRRTAGGQWSIVDQVKSGNTCSLKDTTNLIKGTTYYYTVRAYYGTSLSWYDAIGIAATATANVGLTTVKYTVKVTSTPYYKLAANGQVLASGKQPTELKKGATIDVIPSMPLVEDLVSPGVTYTPFQKDGAVYYVRTADIAKA